MGVRREEWLVTGFKLDQEWIQDTIGEDRNEEMESELDNREVFKKTGIAGILSDGMCGEYTFFGICKQISDGWEGESSEIIELSMPTNGQIEQIHNNWAKYFGDNEMPPIKTYFVPHFT